MEEESDQYSLSKLIKTPSIHLKLSYRSSSSSTLYLRTATSMFKLVIQLNNSSLPLAIKISIQRQIQCLGISNLRTKYRARTVKALKQMSLPLSLHKVIRISALRTKVITQAQIPLVKDFFTLPFLRSQVLLIVPNGPYRDSSEQLLNLTPVVNHYLHIKCAQLQTVLKVSQIMLHSYKN